MHLYFIKRFFSGGKRSVTVKKNILGSLLIKGCSIIISLMLIPMTLGYVNSELYGIWLTLSSIMVWLVFFDIGFTLRLKNKLTEAVARIKKELPDIIEKMYKAPPTVVPDSLDSVYISQITAAQEFINNNRKADLSQIKCILRKMLPKEYHEKIEELRECQEPKIININGGQNLIAPNAKNARQDIQKNVKQ